MQAPVLTDARHPRFGGISKQPDLLATATLMRSKPPLSRPCRPPPGSFVDVCPHQRLDVWMTILVRGEWGPDDRGGEGSCPGLSQPRPVNANATRVVRASATGDTVELKPSCTTSMSTAGAALFEKRGNALILSGFYSRARSDCPGKA